MTHVSPGFASHIYSSTFLILMMPACSMFVCQAVSLFVRSGPARLVSRFFFLFKTIKKCSQTFVYLCFHHLFNDFEKFHPFVTLSSVVALTSRSWRVSSILHDCSFYLMAKLGCFLQTVTSKIMQICAFFVQRQAAPTGDI